MIIKNNLDVWIFVDGDDVIINPGCEYQCDQPKFGEMKFRCRYGWIEVQFGANTEFGIDHYCSNVCLAVFYTFDPTSLDLSKLEIYKRLIFDYDDSSDVTSSDAGSSDTELHQDLHTVYKKPPLGCIPFDITAEHRIHHLASAIDRYSGDVESNTDLIRKWAKEILLQCDLIEHMSE